MTMARANMASNYFLQAKVVALLALIAPIAAASPGDTILIGGEKFPNARIRRFVSARSSPPMRRASGPVSAAIRMNAGKVAP